MTRTALLVAAAGALAIAAPAQAAGPTDPQIAHIAYTAGNLDIAAAKQALKMSHNRMVRDFAQQMVRDHQAVNAKALALVKKLHVTPESNASAPSSASSEARPSTANTPATKSPITRRSTAPSSRR